MKQLAQKSHPIQPDLIQVTVVVNVQQSNLNMQINIVPDIPFNLFAEGIKQQIFAQRMQAQYNDLIEYQLQNGCNISENESRSLQELGFTHQCTLYARLTLKSTCHCTQQKGQKIKVQVEYEMPYNPNITIEEQTQKIKNVIHFDEREIPNFSISSIKIDPQSY